MSSPELKHSLHDASIESVSIGPEREVKLGLHLGSTRVWDDRIPEEATLRLAAIENFEETERFFRTDFGPDPIARIDSLTVIPVNSGSCTVVMRVDPQGEIKVICSELELQPIT